MRNDFVSDRDQDLPRGARHYPFDAFASPSFRELFIQESMENHVQDPPNAKLRCQPLLLWALGRPIATCLGDSATRGWKFYVKADLRWIISRARPFG